MSEFLLELYSEEIPSQLQINARVQLKEQFEKCFKEEGIKYKECLEFSNPNRLTIYVRGIVEKIRVKSKEIKGPQVGVPDPSPGAEHDNCGEGQVRPVGNERSTSCQPHQQADDDRQDWGE